MFYGMVEEGGTEEGESMTDTSKLRETPETDDEWDNYGEHTVDDGRFLLSKKLERHRDELAEGILTLRYSILADSSLMVLTYDLDKLIALARKCK